MVESEISTAREPLTVDNFKEVNPSSKKIIYKYSEAYNRWKLAKSLKGKTSLSAKKMKEQLFELIDSL